MAWLSAWLTKKMAELGAKINALNPADERRVLFFLKGGRALNFFLGTPQNGENDWDTQVVIDPSLPAEKWYEYLSRVHDLLLTTLQTFKSEFTPLVEANASLFADYLKSKTGPETGEDEEVDENEASDVNSRGAHASCKAELIDIGIPRRDSPSALEEWTRLSAPWGSQDIRRRRRLPTQGVLPERIPHDDPRCIHRRCEEGPQADHKVRHDSSELRP